MTEEDENIDVMRSEEEEGERKQTGGGAGRLSEEEQQVLNIFQAMKTSGKKLDTTKLMKLMQEDVAPEKKLTYEDEHWNVGRPQRQRLTSLQDEIMATISPLPTNTSSTPSYCDSMVKKGKVRQLGRSLNLI